MLDPDTGQSRCRGIPYDPIPRLLLFWITTEAVRRKDRKIVLGDSLSSFMRQLDLAPTGGRQGNIGWLKNRMERLFRAKISFELKLNDGDRHGQQWLDIAIFMAVGRAIDG